ncbi:MAG: 30S ribosomal protein S12 methylthiotransferase RimO, partial [Erysipelotrichaceae bacterium]|nr:30S ribosomal protein S12 methylthiotransferase RimO [Erysipelotrichaceae bacterium]
MKVGMISLGCCKNLVDSEKIMGLLVSAGCTIVSDAIDADVLVVNTCGFIEPAKEEAINT